MRALLREARASGDNRDGATAAGGDLQDGLRQGALVAGTIGDFRGYVVRVDERADGGAVLWLSQSPALPSHVPLFLEPETARAEGSAQALRLTLTSAVVAARGVRVERRRLRASEPERAVLVTLDARASAGTDVSARKNHESHGLLELVDTRTDVAAAALAAAFACAGGARGETLRLSLAAASARFGARSGAAEVEGVVEAPPAAAAGRAELAAHLFDGCARCGACLRRSDAGVLVTAWEACPAADGTADDEHVPAVLFREMAIRLTEPRQLAHNTATDAGSYGAVAVLDAVLTHRGVESAVVGASPQAIRDALVRTGDAGSASVVPMAGFGDGEHARPDAADSALAQLAALGLGQSNASAKLLFTGRFEGPAGYTAQPLFRVDSITMLSSDQGGAAGTAGAARPSKRARRNEDVARR